MPWHALPAPGRSVQQVGRVEEELLASRGEDAEDSMECARGPLSTPSLATQPMPCGLLHPAAPVPPPLALPGDGSARLDAPVLPEVRATPHPLPPKRLAALRYAVTLTKRAV